MADDTPEIPHRLRFLIQWGDEQFDSDTLTLLELEVLEEMLGKGFGSVNPLERAGDYAALVTVFRMRGSSAPPADLIVDVAGVTLGEIWRTVTPYAVPTVKVDRAVDEDGRVASAEADVAAEVGG